MRNRSLIIGITAFVTLFCFYILSFTNKAQEVREDATAFATEKDGRINLDKKQAYLDSIYEQPVYNFLGITEYTYKEVKEMELALGLDLQGGMHVTMEVSPTEILKALAGGNASDPKFKAALDRAIIEQRSSTKSLTALFFSAFKDANGSGKLHTIFSNSINASYIKAGATDNEVEAYINKEVANAVDRSFEILRNRIDKFGAMQPNIQKIPGTDRIQVELPGVENRKRVRAMLEGTAQLEFYEVIEFQEFSPEIEKINLYLAEQEKNTKKGGATPADTAANLNAGDLAGNDLTGGAAATPDTNATAKGDTTKKDTSASAKADTTQKVSRLYSLMKGGMFRYEIKDTSKINRILNNPVVQAMLPSNVTLFWDKKPIQSQDKSTSTIGLTAVKKGKFGKPLLGGDVIRDASWGVAQDGAGYEISMQMNTEGARKWKAITTKASASTPPKRIAIVMDGYVYSAPEVNEPIPNGSSRISGRNITAEEAEDLAKILKAGKLPAPVRIVEEVVVGPTLGAEAISSGMLSLGAGLLLVVIFMVMYYNKGGAIADVALVFNIIFILGVMANLNSVLTLPGIAGIVLTIGMSVDANVLIFERIREELRNGRSLKAAIEAGYDKAFSSIFDSNITTILIGVILFFLGSGLVKGFALTLIIGIMTSFFTAVYLSRTILEFIVDRRKDASVDFSTFISRNLFQNLNFNIIGKRKIAYIISGAILLFGVFAITQQGLNLGVDFSGGRAYVVQLKEAKETDDLKAVISKSLDNASVEVKTFGSASKIKITTPYKIEENTAATDSLVESRIEQGLTAAVGQGNFEVQSSTKVGATIAEDIKATSWQSGLLSLVAIFIYIFIRFRKWQFSLGGVVALFHDSLMIIAMFAILRYLNIVAYEVDQVFVAAILTIIGFSINDTVIVFDRVREFTAEQGNKFDTATVLNNSINHTLSRTIMTTFTVLVVVLTLYLFGGETLKGFSFALLIGVVFGSYSTLFIAVPMVLDIRSKSDKEKDDAILAKQKSVKA